ncbi:ATP-binding protein [Flectobacillus sp. DC10W]|uniref:histidine kinase n=1 Tax=Flectobacillus longus TaxID=2984207 RepID=A0ABT6YTE1_9BACT|nr:ATP-binding protein [Flectobacillus longus]MDI9866841.1 ATP-binding protein [Flectobacillus longus]
MIVPAILENEKERLNTVKAYRILDTLPEKDFDDIVQIASQICQTPISTITIIDENRQWFKAKNGLDGDGGPRELSFCAHAIVQPDRPFIIEDARQDKRFSDNPLTVGSPYVVFYAGIPLIAENGHALGTLCVIDSSPKVLEEEQIVALKALASQAMGQLELRKKTFELTETKDRLEQKNYALTEAKENLEIALKAKSTFLSMMSHEIRSPLHAILGNIDLLLEESPRPDQEDSLNVLRFTGETLLSIINDILDFSKLEAGKVQLENISFNVRDLVKNIVSINLHRAQEQGNKILIEIAENVPNYVGGDPIRLVQVINNLVSNAVKFTKNGTITIKINLKEQLKTDNILTIEVIDTGIGIPQESINQIFEEFVQASSRTTRQFGGTGLGLAIIRKILELFGTRILVTSEVGKGSNFFFDLKVAQVQQEVVKKDAVANFNFEGFNVMAIDDNEINLIIINRSLQKKGISVKTFNNAIDALASLNAGIHYDLIIVDLQMPEMSGFEFAEEVRKFSDIPIIASSADNNTETIELALSTGMNDYLLKPHTPQDLYILLAQHLRYVTEE